MTLAVTEAEGVLSKVREFPFVVWLDPAKWEVHARSERQFEEHGAPKGSFLITDESDIHDFLDQLPDPEDFMDGVCRRIQRTVALLEDRKFH